MVCSPSTGTSQSTDNVAVGSYWELSHSISNLRISKIIISIFKVKILVLISTVTEALPIIFTLEPNMVGVF